MVQCPLNENFRSIKVRKANSKNSKINILKILLGVTWYQIIDFAMNMVSSSSSTPHSVGAEADDSGTSIGKCYVSREGKHSHHLV